ncbi:MAG TPA: TonB-dependent receptor [Sphingopyxis sp.]|uniref:TonB-dependent receptor n=1 Tax=Sphingopyxis sp. TaxID=1908224 RepID=UPI002B72F836|nr:TonB-dependent receptor [Sphingopyxis sp.]HWW58554.1 TonB-dependent receptor [Sphingopyxis sp.]
MKAYRMIRMFGLLLGSSTLPGIAMAQDAAPKDAAADGFASEIIVTAQKREQSLQDVPIVVTVASAQLLQDAGVRDIKDLTVLTPGLTVVSTANETQSTALIRGVGTAGGNVGLESSVGVVIDGVYRPRTGVALGDLGEVERIEVLKGPQGTLFGKNTSAGVINVLTAKPGFTPYARGEFTVANYDEFGGSISVGGPIVGDRLAASLFAVHRTRDGYYDVVTGKGPRTLGNDADRHFWSLRGQLYFTNDAGFDARLIGDITRRNENCCVAVQLVNGPTTAIVDALAGAGNGVLSPADPDRRLAFSNRDTTQKIRDGGLSLEINYGLGDATLTSITAWRDWRWVTGSDSDYSGADILYREADGGTMNRFRQISQELRVSGRSGILDYTVGGFYAHEILDSRVAQLYGTDFQPFLSLLFSGGTDPSFLKPILDLAVPGTGSRDIYKQTGDTFALFTNNSVKLTDALELTVGLRYTIDRKKAVADFDATDGGALCDAGQATGSAAIIGALCNPFFNSNFIGLTNAQKRTEKALSGTAKLAYRFSPELMTYASYSRGYKAGGFNLDRVAFPYAAGNPTSLQPVLDTSFPGEFVDSFELGFKSTLADRRLYLNAAAFYQDYTDYQLNAFNGFFFSVFPVPEVTSKGVDADILWRPSSAFTLQGGITYADTRYSEKNRALLSLTPSTANLPGERLNLAPLWSASLSATHELPLGGGLLLRSNANMRYSSPYNAGTDLNPLKLQKSYAVINARIGIGDEDKSWGVELWANNITDKLYMQNSFDAPFQSGSINAFLGAPRTYGITLKAGF